MNTKYIFFDIDGTLLSHTYGISKGTLDTLERLRANGHKIFICTGRSKAYVDDYIRRMPFDGFIYGAGAHVMVGKKTLYMSILPREEIEKMMEFFKAYNISFILEGPNYAFHDEAALKFFRERWVLQTSDTPYLSLHKLADEKILSVISYPDMTEEINKVSVFAKHEEDLELIRDNFSSKYHIISYPTTSSGEIIGEGVNKASGIKHMIRHFGVDLADCVAVGDSMNDYEMIRECGIGIAMGNADPKVKQIADFVTEDVNSEGIATAMRHYGLI